MSTPNELGPSSLFHLTVDYICDRLQTLPDFAGFPEYLLQLILARMLSSYHYEAALKLLRQPNIITSLELSVGLVVRDQWLEAILCQAESLEELTIENSSALTSHGLLMLRKFTRLRRLHLCKLPASGFPMRAVAGLPALEHLHLEGETGTLVLDSTMSACCRLFGGLQHLGLVGATGLDTQCCALVGATCCQLNSVDMSNSDIEDEGLNLLFKALKALQSVALRGCEALSDACARGLATLPTLTTVHLDRTSITDRGVSFLKVLTKLSTLSLCGTRVTDESLGVINSSMKALTALDLSCKRVTDLGLKQLHNLSQLTTLNLSYTQVSDEGMQALRRLPKLKNLSLRWTRITDWAIGTLTNTMEVCQRSTSQRSRVNPRLRNQRLSRSGDYSQVLQRCRATLDFATDLHPGDGETHGETPTATPTSPATAQSDSNPDSTSAPTRTQEGAGQSRLGGSRSQQRLSRSGDYSQVLQRCRASLDFATDWGHAGERHGESPVATPMSPATAQSDSNTDSTSAPTQESAEQPSYRSLFDLDLEPVLSESDFDQPVLQSVSDFEQPAYRSLSDLDFVEQPVFRSLSESDFEQPVFQSLCESLSFEQPVFRSLSPDDGLEMPEEQLLNCTLSDPLSSPPCSSPTMGFFAESFPVQVEPLPLPVATCIPPTNTTICAPPSMGFFSAFEEDGRCHPEDEEIDNTLQEMRVLDLSVTDIADVGLGFLSAFSRITTLNLFSTKVTDDGLKHVGKLDCLVDLDLCGTEVSDIGLTELESLKSLEVLKACGNEGITDGGACRLLTALEALQGLELRSTSCTTDCLRQINEVLKTRIRHTMN